PLQAAFMVFRRSSNKSVLAATKSRSIFRGLAYLGGANARRPFLRKVGPKYVARQIRSFDPPLWSVHDQGCHGYFWIVGWSKRNEPGVVTIFLVPSECARFARHFDIGKKRATLRIVKGLVR